MQLPRKVVHNTQQRKTLIVAPLKIRLIVVISQLKLVSKKWILTIHLRLVSTVKACTECVCLVFLAAGEY